MGAAAGVCACLLIIMAPAAAPLCAWPAAGWLLLQRVVVLPCARLCCAVRPAAVLWLSAEHCALSLFRHRNRNSCVAGAGALCAAQAHVQQATAHHQPTRQPLQVFRGRCRKPASPSLTQPAAAPYMQVSGAAPAPGALPSAQLLHSFLAGYKAQQQRDCSML